MIELPIGVYKKFYALAILRNPPVLVEEVLVEVLADAWEGKEAVSPEEREQVTNLWRGRFECKKKSLDDVLATPQWERPDTFQELLRSERAWFRLNQICPECGRKVEFTRKGKLFCSRRCNKYFNTKVWRKRKRREAKALTNRR